MKKLLFCLCLFGLLNCSGYKPIFAVKNLSFEIEEIINVNDDNSFSRPPSSARWGIEYNQQTFIGSLKFSKLFQILRALNIFLVVNARA